MTCQRCEDEVDEVRRVKVGKKTLRLCESCADAAEQEENIAAEAEGVMQGMMEYKGRR